MSKYDVNSSQFDILQNDTIKYSRKGGYFVTTKKAIVYIVLTLFLSIAVGVLVYKYGPRKDQEQVVSKQENIQELIDKSLRNIPAQNIRLPQTVRPLHYKLKIRPNLDNLSFSGEVSITIEATEKEKYIYLNVDQLQIYNISIHQVLHNRSRRNVTATTPTLPRTVSVSENTTEQNTTSTTTEATTTKTIKSNPTGNVQVIASNKGHTSQQALGNIHIISRHMNQQNFQYSLHLSSPLYPEKIYILSITFSGNIYESLQGLHENSYTDYKGKKRHIIASHFQPVFARRVFPCFDEPSMKATFEITIVHQKDMKSLSNMPLKSSTTLENGWIEDHFETTPPMPTFLVAIALLDSDYYSNITTGNNISIWAPKEHLNYATYPLEKTEKIMKYYTAHFGIKYPLPKLDIITIPTLPSTATENWGLIYFKESVLLSGEDERDIFSFLAKKIAQQWFGNLVSIKWWKDLWLVKGFALLEGDYASVEVNKWTSDFTLRITQKMLALDDFQTPSALQNDIINVLQINELYDSVMHYKGSCLLRMLEHSIPQVLFENGTENFLKTWEYKAVDQNDFWNSITNLANSSLPAGNNVSAIMSTWSSQSGYPLITVVRDEKTKTINVTQSKFRPVNKSDDSLWIVPLNYIIGNGDERKLWLTNRSISIANVSGDEWILFNVRRSGYYRVNYDDNNWKLLINVLNENQKIIPIESRGQLINDAFKLAENSILNYTIPFDLIKYLQKEERYLPWASALNSLEFIKKIIQTTYLNGAYEEYIKDLVSPLYNKTWNITVGHQRLRQLIIETACSVNYEPCIQWATELFSQWMENNTTIPYDLRKTIFCSAIRTGGKDEWLFLWNQIKLQRSNSDIHELFMSLGCTRDTWLINKYMRNALSGAIPWQHVPYIWQSLSQPTSLAFGFKYLREHWDTIYATYKDKPIIMRAIVKDFLYALSSKSDLEDLTSFLYKHERDFQQLASLVQGAVNRIEVRVQWTIEHLDAVEDILLQ